MHVVPFGERNDEAITGPPAVAPTSRLLRDGQAMTLFHVCAWEAHVVLTWGFACKDRGLVRPDRQ